MRSVQIQILPAIAGDVLPINIVCDCGLNGLKDEATGETSFGHRISPHSRQDKILVCDCGERYRLYSRIQSGHTYVHVQEMTSLAKIVATSSDPETKIAAFMETAMKAEEGDTPTARAEAILKASGLKEFVA